MFQDGITDGTMTNIADTFELVVDYDERFEEQVESGDPNPLADLTIKVGEYDLTGATDGRFSLDDYVYFNLRKQLDAVEDVLAGERRELTFYSIPVELVLDPENDHVSVLLLNSRGEVKNDAVPEGGVPVTKETFVAGLIDAAEGFHEKVVEINPDLEDSEQMQTLRDYIQNAKASLSELSEPESQ